ncbi:MAG: Ppx/GppA phosphatase family protein [Deltaproteobacteria bacterium]|nr:Ppx/GppA phosphatase family protein [Deltaproteobacteria bacterium]MDZ4225006.1 Ppx/GppA phosphatase family protein [bacterium]
MKMAVIDIGTHSVLLLIAQKNSDGNITVLADEATLTRIGEKMGSMHVFIPAAMERTLAVLKKYKAICNRHGVEKIIAVGTAAFRKAQNAKDFVEEVKQKTGIAIEIISGEREAALTWKAASTDFGSDIMVIDIGGGSTEIIMGPRTGDHGPWTKSLGVGSVLLTEKYGQDYDKLCEVIENELQVFPSPLEGEGGRRPGEGALVATAGTATTLGAIKKKMKVYHHNEIHGSKLSLDELKNIIADLRSKTIEERKKIPGLEPGRADVILAGSLLLLKTAEHFGFKEITVSDRGVRWGLLYEALKIH